MATTAHRREARVRGQSLQLFFSELRNTRNNEKPRWAFWCSMGPISKYWVEMRWYMTIAMASRVMSISITLDDPVPPTLPSPPDTLMRPGP